MVQCLRLPPSGEVELDCQLTLQSFVTPQTPNERRQKTRAVPDCSPQSAAITLPKTSTTPCNEPCALPRNLDVRRELGRERKELTKACGKQIAVADHCTAGRLEGGGSAQVEVKGTPNLPTCSGALQPASDAIGLRWPQEWTGRGREPAKPTNGTVPTFNSYSKGTSQTPTEPVILVLPFLTAAWNGTDETLPPGVGRPAPPAPEWQDQEFFVKFSAATRIPLGNGVNQAPALKGTMPGNRDKPVAQKIKTDSPGFRGLRDSP